MFAALTVTASLIPHPFPNYPNTFNMTENLYLTNQFPNQKRPQLTRDMIWQTTMDGKDIQYLNSYYHETDVTQGTFNLQIRRCGADKPSQVAYQFSGTVGADPSTFKCFKDTVQPCSPLSPYWVPPLPPHENATWNGTAMINGVRCDRFDIVAPMGNSIFWGTPTKPCRAETAATRRDYMTFDTSEPSPSDFENPSWLSKVTCTTPGSATPVHSFPSVQPATVPCKDATFGDRCKVACAVSPVCRYHGVTCKCANAN